MPFAESEEMTRKTQGDTPVRSGDVAVVASAARWPS
jgi:hypothetical protein